MTEVLIKILNLPIAVQRGIAALFLAVCVFLIVCLIGAIFTTFQQQADEILIKRELLARLDETIARGEDARDDKRALVSSNNFWLGDSEALIQVGLQTKLAEISTSTGVSVLSTVGIRTVEYGGVKYVGLQATLQGKLSAVHKTIVQLESAKPYLSVREVTMRSTNSNPNGALLAPVELSVQLSFFGAINPSLSTQLQVARP